MKALDEERVGRVPPNNLDAERSVLGAMMQDHEALSLALEALIEEDFYHPANKELFDAMHALNSSGQPVDIVTVDEELSRRGTLEGVGGIQYVVEISQYVPTTANVKAYIQIVAEKATLRRLIKASSDISQESYTQQDPVAEILGRAEKAIFDIVMRRTEGSTLVHIADILPDTYQRIENLSRLKGGIDGVPTGFIDLDNLLTGLRGKGGGYKLTKTPDQYTVGSILRLTEGSLAPVSCLESPEAVSCDRIDSCRTLPMWRGLDKLINNYLDNITLADLVQPDEQWSNYVI